MKFSSLSLAGWTSLGFVSTSLMENNAFAFGPSLVQQMPSSSVMLKPKSQSSDSNRKEIMLLFASDDDDDFTIIFSDESSSQTESKIVKNNVKSRWNSLNPKLKSNIIKQGQQKAIMNKKKREPVADKKRRMMMFYKEAQRKSKRDSRIERPMATNDPDRIPLSSLEVDSMIDTMGVVISLTNFGAYIDVGTECDGLLHVSQITREEFVEHPRQLFSPGDTVEGLRVFRVSPELKKLQLSLLPGKNTKSNEIDDSSDPNYFEEDDDDDDEDRIPLEDISVDDELWGEIKRVTSYGAYVELGAAVDGFLHFMDHPEFGFIKGARPSEFMKVRNRVRVWVSDVDMEKDRIKLTANRPSRLPGPKRDFY